MNHANAEAKIERPDVVTTFSETVADRAIRLSAVASHRTAAALYGIGGIAPGIIELSSTVTRRLPPGSDVILHRPVSMPDDDVLLWRGIPMTSPARTLLELGAVVDESVVRRAARDALRKHLITVPQLQEVLARCGTRGKGGTTSLRAVLATLGSEETILHSELEARLKTLLRETPIGEQYVWQPRITLFDNSFVHPDLLFRRRRVLVEALGYEFHSARPDFERDHRRWNAMTASNYTVMFFLYADAERPLHFLRTLRATLDRQEKAI